MLKNPKCVSESFARLKAVSLGNDQLLKRCFFVYVFLYLDKEKKSERIVKQLNTIDQNALRIVSWRTILELAV